MTSELESLRKENNELRKMLADAEKRIAYYETHNTLFEGVRGETIVSKIVNGEITAYAESHDVEVVGKDGAHIEVKMASLNIPVKGANTLRWAWGKILGESGSKEYDWLILVGKKDERYLDGYLDKECPFIFFAIPRHEVEGVTVVQGRYRGIYLTTNPYKAKRSRAGVLYKCYMISQQELAARFGL